MAKSFAAWLSQRKQVKPGSDAMQSNDMHLVRPFDIDIDVRTCFSLPKMDSGSNGGDSGASIDDGDHNTKHLVLNKTIPTIKCAWKMTSLTVQVPMARYSQFLALLRSNFAMDRPTAATATASGSDVGDADSAVSSSATEHSNAAPAAAAATITTATDKSAVVTSTGRADVTDSISWDLDFSIEHFQFDLLAHAPSASDDTSQVRHLLTLHVAGLQARAQSTPRMQQASQCSVMNDTVCA